MVPSYFRGSIGKQLGEEGSSSSPWFLSQKWWGAGWSWPSCCYGDGQNWGTWMISKFIIFLGHSILRQCQLMVSHIIDMYMCNLNISQPSFMIESQGLSTHRCKPPFWSLTTLYHILALDLLESSVTFWYLHSWPWKMATWPTDDLTPEKGLNCRSYLKYS